MSRAGSARTTSAPPERSSDTSGRRSTAAISRPHGPSSRICDRNSGIRRKSTLSARRWSSAGSTVSEPIIAARTTIIVPRPIVLNSELPETNMPAIAINTVAPEISTACPDVRAATSNASWGERPR
jgi:hypothetical protein